MKDTTLWIIAAAIVGVLFVFKGNLTANTGATSLGVATAGGVPSLSGVSQGISAFAAGIEAAFQGVGGLANLDTPGAPEIAATTGASLAPVTTAQAAGTSPLTSSQLSFASNPIPSASQQALYDAPNGSSLTGAAAPVLSGGVV